jgi:hypothetical protein
MKIDIGSDGKILGTKRVSPNGQVSGLSEYAGQEVLIIYPGPRAPTVEREASDYLHEVEAAVHHQMQGAFRQYKALKRRYKNEAAATAEFIRARSPQGFRGLIDTVDEWVRVQVSKAEKRVAKRLGDDKA